MLNQMTEKVSKASVNYSKGMPRSHCGQQRMDDTYYCKHFIMKGINFERDGECQVVQGSISPRYWCKRYARTE
jgi:hypothetical protein